MDSSWKIKIPRKDNTVIDISPKQRINCTRILQRKRGGEPGTIVPWVPNPPLSRNCNWEDSVREPRVLKTATGSMSFKAYPGRPVEKSPISQETLAYLPSVGGVGFVKTQIFFQASGIGP